MEKQTAKNQERKRFENVLRISADVLYDGDGLICCDEPNQLKTLRRFGIKDHIGRESEKNLKLSQKEVYKIGCDENGDVYGYLPVVPSSAIRHSMYRNEMPFCNTTMKASSDKTEYISQLATKAYIGRGWMFADEKSTDSKKTIINMSNARPVGVSPIRNLLTRISTSSGRKNDQSLINVEVVGKHVYRNNVSIDLTEAQFISLDEFHDRCAITMDGRCADGETYTDLYLRKLQENFLSDEKMRISRYVLTTCGAKEEYGERGIKLTGEMVSSLAVDILNKIAGIRIWNSSAVFEFSEMTVTVEMNGLESETFKIDRDSIREIDSYEFIPKDVYSECDIPEERYVKKYKDIYDLEKVKKEKKQEEKKAKAERKKSKKEADAAENEQEQQ